MGTERKLVENAATAEAQAQLGDLSNQFDYGKLNVPKFSN